MKASFIFTTITILLVVLTSTQSIAQTRVMNENGDIYLVYPDNSWKLISKGDGTPVVEEKKDTLTLEEEIEMLNQHVDGKRKSSDFSNGVNDEAEITTKPAKPVKIKTTKELEKENQQKQLDNIRNRKRAACQFSVAERDEYSGSVKKALEQKDFFSHTPEVLRKYLDDKDFLICDGYLSEALGSTILTLNFTFNSIRAQKSYGGIEKGATIIFQTVNNSYIPLKSAKTDLGILDKEKGTTSYSTYYVLDKYAINTLTNDEVSRVRVLWNTGFQDYEIYELDFFVDQFDCLNNCEVSKEGELLKSWEISAERQAELEVLRKERAVKRAKRVEAIKEMNKNKTNVRSKVTNRPTMGKHR